MITENHDFYFEKEYRFRIGSQNGFNKISYDRKICEAKYSSIVSCFKTFTSANVDDEPRPVTSKLLRGLGTIENFHHIN